MRAVVVNQFGPPDVLQVTDVPDPHPAAGEVLIEVTVASVLWVETRTRRTGGPPVLAVEPPYIPGNGVGGRVRQVGPDVDPGWVGRAVVGHTGGGGGYAEQVVLPVEALSVVPDGLPIAAAAALLHDGVTAMSLLDATKVTTDDRVLVVGASGGLGIVSIQLARARGALVVATARDPAKLARLRDLDLGATIVDSDAPHWIVQAGGELGSRSPAAGASVILDNVGGALGEAAFGLIAPEGRFSAHGTPSGRFAQPDPADIERLRVTMTGIDGVRLSVLERRRITDDLLALAVAGQVRNVVGQTLPLAEAARAHAAIENRSVFGATQLVIERAENVEN
jgi:NADPH:quinone reductase